MAAFKVGDKVRIEYDTYWRREKYVAAYHMKTGVITEVFAEGRVARVSLDDPHTHMFSTISVSAKYLKLIPPVVSVGDRVRCTADLIMLRNRPRAKDEVFEVLDGEQAYYQWAVERGDYELLPPEPVYSVLYAKRIIGGGRMSYKRTFEKLAAAIVSAYTAVDEYGYDSASVYVGDSINTIFTCFKMDDAIHCIKSPACKIDKQDIVTALQTED